MGGEGEGEGGGVLRTLTSEKMSCIHVLEYLLQDRTYLVHNFI